MSWFPTTRYDRFVVRRERYRRKLERQRRKKFSRWWDGFGWRLKLSFIDFRKGPKMLPLQVSKKTRAQYRTFWDSPTIPGFVKIKAGHGVFERIRPAFPNAPGTYAATLDKVYGSTGYYQKPVVRRGANPGKNLGAERHLWAVALFHFLNGWWPDDDPFDRHPNAFDLFVLLQDADPQGYWGEPDGPAKYLGDL